MAISSSTHRSLSPVSRTQQGSNPGAPRRSFNGNPLARSSTSLSSSTPVSSPTESPRKSLNLMGFNEFKENEKKAKHASIQKGTKGFMAPTISAISKKSPSPSIRKKVLSERNETVRDETGPKTDIGFDYKVTHSNPSFKPRALDYEPDSVDITLKFSQETTLVLPEKIDEPKIIPVGSAEKPTNPPLPSSPYPAIAPLDSDPHLPPYDPKTNYLSPRPRFLHYKPRPRIDFVEEGKKLEESFSSGSCSDTDENPSSGSSLKETLEEDDYLSELVPEDNETQTLISEPTLDYTQTKRTRSSRSFVGSKIASFLLVFVIACLSFQVIDTPVLPRSTYQVQSFSMDATAKLAESVSANIKDLASNLKLWSSNTISRLSMLMAVPRVEVDHLGSLYFSNNTLINEECCFEKFVSVQVEADSDQIDEENVITREEEHKVVTEILGESEIEDQEILDDHIISEPLDTDAFIPSESAEVGVNTANISELDDPILTESESSIEPQASELDDSMHTQSSPSGFISENMQLDDSALPQSLTCDFHSENQEIIDVGNQGSEMDTLKLVDGMSQSSEMDTLDAGVETVDEIVVTDTDLGSFFSSKAIGGIVLSLVTAAAATTYVCLERRKAAKPSASMIGDSGEHRHPHGVSSPPKTAQAVDDSCCSEVSSSFKRSSPNGVDDTQSSEKRQRYPKREVLPSSSEYSYGSFTTYEKIHAKHGYGEDEVVTPVRRSSRIRKITSP